MDHFVITGARVFDGEDLLGVLDVEIADGKIARLGGERPDGVEVVDGEGATLIPGLIDAHTHTNEELLGHALLFGVTTELDMLSLPDLMVPLREVTATSMEIADVRSPSVGLTPPDGHPHQLLHEKEGDPKWPVATTVDEVPDFVEGRIAEGADYLKVLVEDGRMFGTELPVLEDDLVAATVREGNKRGKMVLAHALTAAATELAIDAGIDGLAHLFFDCPASPELVEKIADSGAFVVPTMSEIASITGEPAGAELAQDPRVSAKLSPEWIENLSGAFRTMPHEHFGYALAAVEALHEAGVDILAGTDAPYLGVPGMAHGASLHSEMQMLVRAGLTPTEALRAATSTPARRFGMEDRGRVKPGLRADLVLVDGDPTETISDTLSIRGVWRGGVANAKAVVV